MDLEARTNYEEYVNLMDYAIQVLDVLDRIRTRRQTEYRGFVFQTYLALTSEDALREGHLALVTEGREARSEGLGRLSFLESSYETMDDLLHEIDRRNAQYAKASLEQVRYMLNSSRDTEGQLINLLRFAAERIAGGQAGWRENLQHQWEDLFALATVGAVEDRSLFTPRRARELMKPETLVRQAVDGQTRREALARAHFQVANRLTVERVNRHVLERLGAGSSLQAKDLGVDTLDDFVLLIHMAAYSTSRKAVYQVDFEGPAVESAAGRFRFRNVTIRRKKHA